MCLLLNPPPVATAEEKQIFSPQRKWQRVTRRRANREFPFFRSRWKGKRSSVSFTRKRVAGKRQWRSETRSASLEPRFYPLPFLSTARVKFHSAAARNSQRYIRRANASSLAAGFVDNDTLGIQRTRFLSIFARLQIFKHPPCPARNITKLSDSVRQRSRRRVDVELCRQIDLVNSDVTCEITNTRRTFCNLIVQARFQKRKCTTSLTIVFPRRRFQNGRSKRIFVVFCC